MNDTEDRTHSTRVLVLAPLGRDGVLTCELLQAVGLAAAPCQDGDDLCVEIARGAGVAVITQEAITPGTLDRLAALLAGQEPWSDFPFVVFTSDRPGYLVSTEALARLGNVTLLERPVSVPTMLSAVHAGLRARGRQYDAHAAIRGRDQFLAMLGHELRNPLGAILLASEIMNRSGEADSPFARERALVERQSRHLARLVDDLLDVARVTSGKIVLNRVPLDLNEVVARCVQSLASTARAAGLRMKARESDEPVAVEGDVLRLEQMMTNLVGNAIKYTPPGGSIEVSVHGDAAHAKVCVRDSGAGIAPEMLPRVFDLFVQAESSLDRARGGLGIGLTLARTIARLHGGDIEARSSGIGQGSEFRLLLPRVSGASTVPEDIPSFPIAQAALRVMVIEDSDDNREMLHVALRSMGHDVSVAGDGRAGLERVVAERPDVALIDIGLPEMDGYVLAQRVRERLGHGVRLIAMTGYGQPEDRCRAFEAGFDAHLTKPVDIDVLAAALEDHDAPK